MNKLVVSMLCVLTLVPSFTMGVGVDSGRCGSFLPPSSDDSGMTPGGVQKKYVGLLFDVINTTPSNILANADQFAEHAPYLDGVAIALHDIPAITPEGTVVTAQHHTIMHPTQRWTRDAIKDQLPILKEIVKKPNLKESFLLFWQTPGHKTNRLDWADDKAWANYAENMANVAWLAKEAGLKGLMLDPEEYKLAPQYIHTDRDPPFDVCARLARQRGREVFTRVFKEFPDAVIWSLWFFQRFSWWMEGGSQQYPLNYCDDSAELSQHYYNGMLDAMTPQSRAVDGAEQYSGSSLDNTFIHVFINQSLGAMAFVAPENMDKFRSQFHFANTHFLDMYTLSAKPSGRWYHGPVNGSRLEHLRLNLRQSLRASSKYVWIYAERNGKLFNWRNGHYAKQKTWEEVIPGMTETMMMVKDPTGLAERRKAQLKAEGKLVNLANDFKPVILENPGNDREFVGAKGESSYVKGLKSGERYQISAECSISSMHADPKSIYRTHLRVYWMKGDKRLSDKAVEIPIAEGGITPKQRSVSAYGVVVVPEGADAMYIEAAANLKCGEDARVWNLVVSDALDPVVPEKAKAGKWVYDEKNKTLSNGTWLLSAQVDKKLKMMTVRGNNEKTVGEGVLDLTSVKDDTGYLVTRLGKLMKVEKMTGVVAPQVSTLLDGGISGSTNVRQLVLGSVAVPSWAKSEFSKRRALVAKSGCRTQIKKKFDKRWYYSTRPVKRPQEPLSVKGVKPGELYSVGLSMKRRGGGWAFNKVCFRGAGTNVPGRVQSLAMRQPRKDNVWRSGEIVVRVPEGADEMYFDISAEVGVKVGYYEYKDFKVYKIGEPLPVWPAECLREKTWGRK